MSYGRCSWSRCKYSSDIAVLCLRECAREHAICKEISLVRETINGNTAQLEYAQKDVCGNQTRAPEKQLARMIDEGGWKIGDVESNV